jgi:hypothetical protein
VIEVSREEARRIAVRAQLLDGSTTGVLRTVRRDLAERWYPEVERISWPEAQRVMAKRRLRTQGRHVAPRRGARRPRRVAGS